MYRCSQDEDVAPISVFVFLLKFVLLLLISSLVFCGASAAEPFCVCVRCSCPLFFLSFFFFPPVALLNISGPKMRQVPKLNSQYYYRYGVDVLVPKRSFVNLLRFISALCFLFFFLLRFSYFCGASHLYSPRNKSKKRISRRTRQNARYKK